MDFLNGKVCGNDEKKIPADIFPLYGNAGSLSLPSPGCSIKDCHNNARFIFFPEHNFDPNIIMRSFIGSVLVQFPPLSNIGKEIVKEPWRMKLAYGNVCYSSLLLSPQGAQALRIVTTMGDLFCSCKTIFHR